MLGIDPGLNTTGYGVLEVSQSGPVVCEAGVVRGVTKKSLTARVREIHDGVQEVLETWKPVALALEQLYSHYQRPRTAILMGHARGVICLAAEHAGVPVFNYASTRVKRMLTGHGHATKQQMQLSIQRELKLAEPPTPADVADALAIALAHYYLQPDWSQLARRARS